MLHSQYNVDRFLIKLNFTYFTKVLYFLLFFKILYIYFLL